MFLRPFGLYCSARFGILFVSILCTCCNHLCWYCFISFTLFCTPSFYIVVLVLVFYLCPSSVRVVTICVGTVLFSLLCSVPPVFP
jgi:hypothetical protein